jgi:hypothetical protein
MLALVWRTHALVRPTHAWVRPILDWVQRTNYWVQQAMTCRVLESIVQCAKTCTCIVGKSYVSLCLGMASLPTHALMEAATIALVSIIHALVWNYLQGIKQHVTCIDGSCCSLLWPYHCWKMFHDFSCGVCCVSRRLFVIAHPIVWLHARNSSLFGMLNWSYVSHDMRHCRFHKMVGNIPIHGNAYNHTGHHACMHNNVDINVCFIVATSFYLCIWG